MERNYKVLDDLMKRIENTPVMIVGQGGVGGILSEFLVRAGFRKLAVSDGSMYEVPNVNRQIGATFLTSVTGLSKSSQIYPEDNTSHLSFSHCPARKRFKPPE